MIGAGMGVTDICQVVPQRCQQLIGMLAQVRCPARSDRRAHAVEADGP